MYEIVTNDPILSRTSGNKLELLRQLQSGWRPDLSNVKPLSRSIIERIWSMNAEERSTFADTWRELYVGVFDIIPGITKIDVIIFCGWIEVCGCLVN
jgi:hypothetical protein